MAGDTRRRMVEGAARLLAEKGLQETSFSGVLDLTGTPRGSIYHHFPGGKDELVVDAVQLAGTRALALMETVAGSPATDVVSRFVALWREVLARSEFRAGCSVVAVTVATDSPGLLDETAGVFRRWRTGLADLLARGGMPETSAHSFAAVLIASTEGAVVVSRAERSLEPFELVAADLVARAAALSGSGDGGGR